MSEEEFFRISGRGGLWNPPPWRYRRFWRRPRSYVYPVYYPRYYDVDDPAEEKCIENAGAAQKVCADQAKDIIGNRTPQEACSDPDVQSGLANLPDHCLPVRENYNYKYIPHGAGMGVF